MDFLYIFGNPTVLALYITVLFVRLVSVFIHLTYSNVLSNYWCIRIQDWHLMSWYKSDILSTRYIFEIVFVILYAFHDLQAKKT